MKRSVFNAELQIKMSNNVSFMSNNVSFMSNNVSFMSKNGSFMSKNGSFMSKNGSFMSKNGLKIRTKIPKKEAKRLIGWHLPPFGLIPSRLRFGNN